MARSATAAKASQPQARLSSRKRPREVSDRALDRSGERSYTEGGGAGCKLRRCIIISFLQYLHTSQRPDSKEDGNGRVYYTLRRRAPLLIE